MPQAYIPIPDWFSFDNQGANIALASLSGAANEDVLVITADNPAWQNRGVYRIGRQLDAQGAVTGGWTPWIDIPDWFSWENQGVGATVANLQQNGQRDLIVFMIDSPPGQNQGYYRIGKALDADGTVTGGWGPWVAIPDWFSWENQHGAIAVADLDGDGDQELIVFMIDNALQQNRGVYRIGRRLDADGNVTGGWTPWFDVPDWFSWENQGAGVAIVDLDNTGQQDLLIFQIDNAPEQNQAFYKIGRRLGSDGNVAEWGPWRGIPSWFSWENEGGGIAAVRNHGKAEMLVMLVDNPPGQNLGYYRLVPLDSDPQRDGQWEQLSFHSGVLAVHTALLPHGKVLFFAGSGSSAARFDAPAFGDIAQGVPCSVVWDPAAAPPNNFFVPNTLFAPNGRPFDLFCCGHSALADGRLLCAGGTGHYNPFTGRNEAAAFDPGTQQWSFVQSMAHGRWYPTLITLGDGRVLAATGLTEDMTNPHNPMLELYDHAMDTWQARHFAPDFPGLPLYAHLFLLADGRICFDGGRMDDELAVDPCIIDLTHEPAQTIPIPGLQGAALRNQAASVLLPPAQDQRVMVIGGGPAGKPNKTDAIDSVDIVDLKAPNPQFVAAAPLNFPRLHLNAVLLPDRTVFVTGGSLKQEDAPLARLQPEIYDPATDTWTPMASSSVPRLYHSTALLLPDGRVAAAGGNPEGGMHVQWDQDPQEEMRLEIFSPPYLFRGARPTIAAAPAQGTYGDTFTIQSPQAPQIRWASLIASCVTTHSFDNNQRLVDLPIRARGGGTVMAQMPDNPNLAPPGWYMLFLVDNDGVPSIAHWIRIA